MNPLMFLHILFTWLLANLLHPLLLALVMYLGDGDSLFLNGAGIITGLIQFSFYSMLISLPCLFLGWGLLYVIVSLKDSILVKFIAWMITTALLIIFEFMAIVFLVDEPVEIGLLIVVVPAIVSTWIAIGIRHKQFTNLVHQPGTNDPA